MKISLGKIKSTASDFKVFEVPLYQFDHSGQHVYIEVQKCMLTTDELIEILAAAFAIKRNAIGSAGLKDKHAVTTQFLSLDLGSNYDPSETLDKLQLDNPQIKILNTTRHSQKLKRGHLLGNRFEVIVRGSFCEQDYISANSLIETIIGSGMVNYYGPQRFGDKGDNHLIGESIMRGEKKLKNRFRKNLYLQAYQSYLFNRWLDFRKLTAPLGEILIDDYVMEHERGRPRLVTDENLDELKTKNNLVTGILYGKDNLSYLSASDHLFLDHMKLDVEFLKKLNLNGSRRMAVIFPEGLKLTKVDDGLLFKFFLPKGSYATTLLDEFFERLLLFKDK